MMVSDDLKAVLFDVDDTLFDRKTAVKRALRLMMEQMPDLFADMQEERVFVAFGDADEMAREDFDCGKPGSVVRDNRSRRFLHLLGLPEMHSERITKQYIGAFPEVSAEVAGARMVIEKLADIFRLGVVSNAYPDVQYNKLRGIGILDYFSAIILSEECGFRKPDERIFHRAAEALLCDSMECLYIGNSFETDIVGAMKAGMKGCWFNAEGRQIQPGDGKPDFEIAQLPELLEILGVSV